jgi:protein involved in polysaccharide export with SLBB domain
MNTVTPDQLAADMQATSPPRLKPLQLASLGNPVTSEFRIHPGDMLDVTVSDLIGENMFYPVPTRVMEDGTVRLPLVGPVVLAGMSIPAAEQSIFAAYASQGILKKPQVTVALRETRKVRVFVLGAVNKPGQYDINATEGDLLNALVNAGGLTQEAGTMVEVRRRLTSGPSSPPARKDRNVVQSGNWQLAEPLPSSVSSAGSWRKDYNVAQATTANSPYHGISAGASSSASAGKLPASVLRAGAAAEPMGGGTPGELTPLSGDSQLFRFDLMSERDKQRVTQGFRLENGDTISIDDRKVKPIYVIGMVNKPGEYPLPVDRDLRVLEAIGLASGVDRGSLPDKALVIRQRPDGSGVQAVRIDLTQAKKDNAQNIRLMAGDTVSVEETAISFTRGLLRGAVHFAFGAALQPAYGF